MNYLYIIPARGGSKGIPYKNIKLLAGKPLISYSIDIARQFTVDENICVTTDDEQIIEVVEAYGLHVPFKRPDYLATDLIGTYDVLLHAVEYYESLGKRYDAIVLLQPTSPFRTVDYVKKAMSLYRNDIEMIVSVKEAVANPYYNCFEENTEGLLHISKGDGLLQRRQDAPKAWEFNGSIYVINIESLKEKNMSEFSQIKKIQMDEFHSIDIDNMFDWKIAELILKEKLV